MIVAVFSGTREATKKLHEELVRTELLTLKPTVVIVGGAKGIDKIAEDICKELSIPVMVVTAAWDAFGKAAGNKRNGRMLMLAEFLRATVEVVAFPASNVPSTGTEDMIKQARSAGIEPKVISIEVAKEVWEWTTTTAS